GRRLGAAPVVGRAPAGRAPAGRAPAVRAPAVRAPAVRVPTHRGRTHRGRTHRGRTHRGSAGGSPGGSRYPEDRAGRGRADPGDHGTAAARCAGELAERAALSPVPGLTRPAEPTGLSRPLNRMRGMSSMADVAFVALTVAVFALFGLVLRAVTRL